MYSKAYLQNISYACVPKVVFEALDCKCNQLSIIVLIGQHTQSHLLLMTGPQNGRNSLLSNKRTFQLNSGVINFINYMQVDLQCKMVEKELMVKDLNDVVNHVSEADCFSRP